MTITSTTISPTTSTDIGPATRSGRPRRLGRAVAVLLVALVAVLGLGLPQASAYSRLNNSGRPGSTYAYQVQGTHFQVACGAAGYYNCFGPGLSIPGPLVYRSPATTGTQYVVVNTAVYRWSNGWYIETQRSQTLTIPAGSSSVRFGHWNVLPATGGYKYVAHAIIWGDAYSRPIASQGLALNGADYACNTRFTWACSAQVGSVGVWRP